MEDLPNGFLNYPKKRPGFESAGDAIRRAESEARYGNQPSIDFKTSEKKAIIDGWRVDPVEELTIDGVRPGGNWGSETHLREGGIAQYLTIPSNVLEVDGPEFDHELLERIKATDRRWSWVEISRSAIHNNVMAIKATLEPKTMLMAVVKADGYGHGAVEVAKTAVNSGATYLGVATVNEGVQLREAHLEAPILILSEPPINSIPLLLAYRLMPAVSTAEFAIKYAEAADSIGRRAPYHLKLNTGMNRVGVRFEDVIEFMHSIAFHRALDLVGTFTHFATADSVDTMDFKLQRQRFEDALYAMETAGIDPGIVHAANSSAILRYPEVQYDMVRLGIAMYGCYPCPETYGRVNLLPAMSVHARITQVTHVPVGEGVSYGLKHRSSGFAKTCTIPVGYADGLKKNLSGKIDFIMNGLKFPQVGDICMDQCMFEVDQRTRSGIGRIEPQIGDEVIVMGSQGDSFVTLEEMAELLHTIPYEIMIGFGSSRLPRIYV